MKKLLICALTLGLGGAASTAAPAAAQPSATLDRYRPAATPEDEFHLNRPTDLGHLRYGVQLSLDYGLNPLVYERTLGDASSESLAVVQHQLNGTVGLSLGLVDRVVVYAGLPVTMVMDGADASALGARRADGAGLGDVYLGARARILGEANDLFVLAAQATLTLPTSGGSAYRGDGTVTVTPQLIGELRPIAGLRILANVGARLREPSNDPRTNLGFGHELQYGLGVAAPVWHDDANERTHLDLLAQIYGDSDFDRIGLREGTALEATLGARYFHACGFIGGLAAGPGLARGFGSPDLRAVVTLGWAPAAATAEAPADRDGDGVLDAVDACPDAPEDVDAFEDADGCPDLDDDADGIPDTADACRLEPESANGWQDTDGCPDEIPDTDGDGLRDDVDACVDAAEDRDEWQDTDGCPDPDDDGDGVLDADDRCRREAGVAANAGCPDPDRDTDTVVDRLDNCPDEPGTVENQGCQATQTVTIGENGLQILEQVFFRTNAAVILPRSFPLLENVARVLNSHPEITRIVVEGHTDARGDHDRNVRLSQERAEAVVRFLVDRGHVDAARLTARGFGPDRPRIADASTPEQHAQNRRVEFNIPNGAAGVQQVQTEAGHDSIDR